LDAAFVNPYLVAVQNVFTTMLGIQIAMGKPELKHDSLTSGEVTGVMGFAGDKKGMFSFSLTKESTLQVYKSMVGEEAQTITPEVIDCIGELTNIISGQARVQIEKLGYKLSAALPTVIVGEKVEISFITKVPVVVLPFTFQVNGTAGKFYLDFSFE
jgi:chemotaxis protein CheX